MVNERIEDNIVIMTLENGKTNSLTYDMLKQIRETVKRVNTDKDLKGIIFTGAGRMMCSGFNLPMFLGFKDLKEVVTFFEEEEEILLEFFTCQKPIIAAMNGTSVAGGLIFSMAADYRICKNHPKIKVGMSEIKIGLGLSLAQTMVMQFGFDSAKKFRDVMYNGLMVDPAAAKELGMVDELVETDEDLIRRAKETVKLWWDCPGHAFTMLKSGLREPHAARTREQLKDKRWHEAFNCFFDPATRKTLEMVQSMMG